MTADPGRRWRVGDRVVWPHEELVGRHYEPVWSYGTVIAVDVEGQLPGVRVRFDRPVNGVWHCYATHDELEPEG